MDREKKIIIAADHRGFAFKEFIKQSYTEIDPSIALIDVGAFTDERSDYPVFVQKAIERMHENPVDGIILLCGSGNGMALTANRFKGIFACVAWNSSVAQASKQDDNCNVLVLPADYIQQEEIIEIISSWLRSSFKGGRYAARLEMVDSF